MKKIILQDIKDSHFLKELNNNEIKQLCNNIREFIIWAVQKNGGHLSPNLGTVESITMMHKIWDLKKDKFYFDIGHQSYTHKILTGRAKDFDKLRHLGGTSGFLKRRESVYDIYEGGHSSSAVNVGIGRSLGRDLKKDNYEVVSYIGDASFSNGVIFEGLNHLGFLKNKHVIILNDNHKSISPPVGALSEKLVHISNKFLTKDIICLRKTDPNNPFFSFNINYIGVIDGHDIDSLEYAYKWAQNCKESCIIHIVTLKGKGLKYAEEDRYGKYHSVSAGFNIETGEIKPTNTMVREQLKTEILYNYMKSDSDIVVISSAMMNKVNLDVHSSKFNDRIYDVGIQEEHASLLGIGLVDAGKKVYLDYYATFINRAYDMLVHDYTRMGIPAILSLNNTGLDPSSGNTHHVLYQLTTIASLPNTIIAQPSSTQDFYDIYEWAFNYDNKKEQIFIRTSGYPIKREDHKNTVPNKIKKGQWKVAYKSNKVKAFLVCYDAHVEKFKTLIEQKKLPIQLINALFLKPFDIKMIKEMLAINKPIWIYDDTYFDSGLGSIVLNYLKKKDIDVKNLHIKGFDKYYPQHGTFESILKESNHEWNQLLDIIVDKIKE